MAVRARRAAAIRHPGWPLVARMLSQERELTGKRVSDDQKRFAEDARRDMLRQHRRASA